MALVAEIAWETTGGPCWGSGTAKDRVPSVPPRRSRTMRPSILASLSKAGGNDPHGLLNGPLPPHSHDVADRVGTRDAPVLVPAVARSCFVPQDFYPTHSEGLGDSYAEASE